MKVISPETRAGEFAEVGSITSVFDYEGQLGRGIVVCDIFVNNFSLVQVSLSILIMERWEIKYGIVWYGTWYGMVRYGIWYIVWYGMVWYGMVWYGMVWYGMVWYGMVWYGMVWYGIEASSGWMVLHYDSLGRLVHFHCVYQRAETGAELLHRQTGSWTSSNDIRGRRWDSIRTSNRFSSTFSPTSCRARATTSLDSMVRSRVKCRLSW